MKTRKALNTALILILMLILSCTSVEQGPMAIGSALVILDELERSVEDVSNEIEYAANKTINNASIQLQTNIHELRQSIQSVSDDVDQKITKQQFLALDNLTNLANEFETISTSTIEDLQHLNNSLGQVLSDLPFGTNEPRINETTTNIFVKSWSRNLEVILKGYNLDNINNVLRIGDYDVSPVKVTSTEIKFLMPKDSIDLLINEKEEHIQHLKTTLSTYYRKKWFAIKKTSKEFPLDIKVLPRKIGYATVIYEDTEWQQNISTIVVPDCIARTRGTGWRGRARSGRTSCSYSTPTELLKSCNKEVKGKIVPGSIVVNVLENRHGGDHHVVNVSDVGFTVNVHAKSESKPGGGGGKYHVRTSYKCKYPCKVPKDKVIKNVPIVIGSDWTSKEIGKANEPRFKRASIHYFDGTNHILTHRQSKSSLINIEYNETLKQLIIKPIRIFPN